MVSPYNVNTRMSSVSGVPFVPEYVRSFVARLAQLPASEWVEVGRALAANREGLVARSTARATLDATIANRGLSMAAWSVRDAVETAACLAGHAARRWSPADRRFLAHARDAAEGAALALLARDYLTAKDCDLLYAPFAAYIPMADTLA